MLSLQIAIMSLYALAQYFSYDMNQNIISEIAADYKYWKIIYLDNGFQLL